MEQPKSSLFVQDVDLVKIAGQDFPKIWFDAGVRGYQGVVARVDTWTYGKEFEIPTPVNQKVHPYQMSFVLRKSAGSSLMDIYPLQQCHESYWEDQRTVDRESWYLSAGKYFPPQGHGIL